MKRLILSLAFLFSWAAVASAATCPAGTMQLKDNAGNTFNMTLIDDGTGSGNCVAAVDYNTHSQAHADVTAPIPQQTATSNFIGNTGDIIVTPSSGGFTRPANVTQYSVGNLVANSTTAASVVPMSWTAARVNAGNFYVRRFRMTLSSKSITSTSFRLHLFTVTPATITNGDGGAFSVTEANEFCTMDTIVSASNPVNWQAGADVSIGYGTPAQGNECNAVAAGGTQTIYGLLEARATYTPTSGETITVIPEIHQN